MADDKSKDVETIFDREVRQIGYIVLRLGPIVIDSEQDATSSGIRNSNYSSPTDVIELKVACIEWLPCMLLNEPYPIL